ncbi:MAG: LWR-salt protein [Halobellus sp.]|uniref:LWR-salt protein n=1 Tax=Halobellus sp. TaxID=1979212 RepID=UPI0035D46AA2
MQAAYVFRAEVRLGADSAVTVTPDTVETVVEVDAAPPGEDGWLLFRDALWRGDVADERHARDLAASWVTAPVVDISFSELHLDEAYRDALQSAIAANPSSFCGDHPQDVLHRHLGSSIHVVDE